jgi:hypothetical protein
MMVKREALLPRATANIQNFYAGFEVENFQHPLVDIAASKLGMNVDAFGKVIGCFLKINLHFYLE